MTLHEIISFLDNRNSRLITLYNRCRNNEERDVFSDTLIKYAREIRSSNDERWHNRDWSHINISRCLKGLKGLNSYIYGVKEIIEALTDKINTSDAVLDAQAIGNALYGLQNMDSSSERVKDLLKALADKINKSHYELNSQSIGNALYGLQNMDSSSERVKDLIKAIESSKPNHISNIHAKIMLATSYTNLDCMTKKTSNIFLKHNALIKMI